MSKNRTLITLKAHPEGWQKSPPPETSWVFLGENARPLAFIYEIGPERWHWLVCGDYQAFGEVRSLQDAMISAGARLFV